MDDEVDGTAVYSIHPPRFVVLSDEEERPPSPLGSETDTNSAALDDASWDTERRRPLDLSSIDGASAKNVVKPRVYRLTSSPSPKREKLPPSYRSKATLLSDDREYRRKDLASRAEETRSDILSDKPSLSVTRTSPPSSLINGKTTPNPRTKLVRRNTYDDSDPLDKEAGKNRQYTTPKRASSIMDIPLSARRSSMGGPSNGYSGRTNGRDSNRSSVKSRSQRHYRKASGESMPDDEQLQKNSSPDLTATRTASNTSTSSKARGPTSKPPRSPEIALTSRKTKAGEETGEAKQKEPQRKSESQTQQKESGRRSASKNEVDSEISEIKKGIEELEALLAAARKADKEKQNVNREEKASEESPAYKKIVERARENLKNNPVAEDKERETGGQRKASPSTTTEKSEKPSGSFDSGEVSPDTTAGMEETDERSLTSSPDVYAERKASKSIGSIRSGDSSRPLSPDGRSRADTSTTEASSSAREVPQESSFLSQVANSTIAAGQLTLLTASTAGEAVENLLLGEAENSPDAEAQNAKPLPTNYSSGSDSDVTDVRENLTSERKKRLESRLGEIEEESEVEDKSTKSGQNSRNLTPTSILHKSPTSDKEIVEISALTTSPILSVASDDEVHDISRDASSHSTPPPPPPHPSSNLDRTETRTSRSPSPESADNANGVFESSDDSTPPPPPRREWSSPPSSATPSVYDTDESTHDDQVLSGSKNTPTQSSDRSYDDHSSSHISQPSVSGSELLSDGSHVDVRLAISTTSSRKSDHSADLSMLSEQSSRRSDQGSHKSAVSSEYSRDSQHDLDDPKLSFREEQKKRAPASDPKLSFREEQKKRAPALASEISEQDVETMSDTGTIPDDVDGDFQFREALNLSHATLEALNKSASSPLKSRALYGPTMDDPSESYTRPSSSASRPSSEGVADSSVTPSYERNADEHTHSNGADDTITPLTRASEQTRPSDERRGDLRLPRATAEINSPVEASVEKGDVIMDPTLLDSDSEEDPTSPGNRSLLETHARPTKLSPEETQPKPALSSPIPDFSESPAAHDTAHLPAESSTPASDRGSASRELSNTESKILSQADLNTPTPRDGPGSDTKETSIDPHSVLRYPTSANQLKPYLAAETHTMISDTGELDASLNYEAHFVNADGEPYIPSRYLTKDGHPATKHSQLYKLGGKSKWNGKSEELDMVNSLNTSDGIAKGDIALSLLDENASQADSDARGSDKIHTAIWRVREMRRKFKGGRDKNETERSADRANLPKRKSSLLVDVDQARVVGDNQILKLQASAIACAENDEFDDGAELFEDIIFTYTEVLSQRQEQLSHNGSILTDQGSDVDYSPHIGRCLHNIGILHLLNDEYEKALIFFQKASVMLKSSLGADNMEYVTSLVRLAMCFFAVDNFPECHELLEEALELAKGKNSNIADIVQIGEILNNLGCLSFMCGNTGVAVKYFKESLEVQFVALSQCLYGLSNQVRASVSLNISISRANVGYVKLIAKDTKAAIAGFESALMSQQLILSEGDDAVIATMDNLAIANLLQGHKGKALLMLNRMLYAQAQTFGHNDPRCVATLGKINMVQTRDKELIDRIWEVNEAPSSGRKAHQSSAQKPKSSAKKGGKRGFGLMNSLRLKKNTHR